MNKIVLTKELIDAIVKVGKTCKSKGLTTTENSVFIKGDKAQNKTTVCAGGQGRWCRQTLTGDTEDFEVCIEKQKAIALLPFYENAAISVSDKVFIIETPTGGLKLLTTPVEEFAIPSFEVENEKKFSLKSFSDVLNIAKINLIDPAKNEFSKNSNVVDINISDNVISAVSAGNACGTRVKGYYPENIEKSLRLNYEIVEKIIDEKGFDEESAFCFAENETRQKYAFNGFELVCSKISLDEEKFKKLTNSISSMFDNAEENIKVSNVTLKGVTDKLKAFSSQCLTKYPLKLSAKQEGVFFDLETNIGRIKECVPAVDSKEIGEVGINTDFLNAFEKTFAAANANEHSKKEMKTINISFKQDVSTPIVFKGVGVDENGKKFSIEHLALQLRIK